MGKAYSYLLIIGLIGVLGCGKAPYKVRSLDKLEKMAPFRGKVDMIYVESSASTNRVAALDLSTKEHGRIGFGSMELESTRDFVAFVMTLKEGQSYEFPKVWLDFKRSREKASESM